VTEESTLGEEREVKLRRGLEKGDVAQKKKKKKTTKVKKKKKEKEKEV